MNTHISPSLRGHLLLLLSSFALFLFGLPHLHGQNDAPAAATTLADHGIVGPYIASALRNNPGLQAADKRYLAARQSIDFAGALPNPKIQLTHFVESIQTRTGPQRQTISIQQPLPWRGKLDSNRAAARAESEALWHAYAAQQFTLADSVASQVLEVAFLDQAIRITKSKIDLLRRLETIVEDKVKAGGNLSDLLKLQLEIQSIEDQVAKLETKRAAAAATLQSLIGPSSNAPSAALTWQAPTPIETSSEEWLTAITERSPQIAMMRSLQDSKAARQRLASYASKPDLSFGLNYIRTSDALNPNTPDSGKDPWALMVGVSLPIWGKANNALALQASLETEAIAAEIENLKLTLSGQGKTWIAKMKDAQNRIQRYKTSLLPLARQSQEITQAAYQSGKASILDLIDSDRQLLKLETEYWRAAADAWQARWKLATLSGGLWLEN